MNWPAWWEWGLEITPHLEKRMVQRDFTEVDVRSMWDRATGYRPAVEPGRWIVETSRKGSPWEIVVEPDHDERLNVVITAYGME